MHYKQDRTLSSSNPDKSGVLHSFEPTSYGRLTYQKSPFSTQSSHTPEIQQITCTQSTKGSISDCQNHYSGSLVNLRHALSSSQIPGAHYVLSQLPVRLEQPDLSHSHQHTSQSLLSSMMLMICLQTFSAQLEEAKSSLRQLRTSLEISSTN